MNLKQLKKENRIGIIIYDKSCIENDPGFFMRVIGAVDTVEIKKLKYCVLYLCYYKTFIPIKFEKSINTYGVYISERKFINFYMNDPGFFMRDDWGLSGSLSGSLSEANEMYKSFTLKKKLNKL